MRIVMNSDPRLLHILRGAVRLRVQASGLPEASVDSLALAIDEAASNVIRHGYDNRHDCQLALEIRSFPDRLEFILEDSGRKVCPEDIRPRDLNELRPGGLGTHIIRCCMDEVCYEACDPNGNRLRMVKYLARKAPPGDQNSSTKDG